MPQQRFTVTAPNESTLDITGDHVPTEAELREIFKGAGVDVPASSQPETTQTQQPESGGVLSTMKDVGVGALKGAAKTAVGLGELVTKIPGVETALDATAHALSGVPDYSGERNLESLVTGAEPRRGLTARSFDWARSQLEPTNTPQTIGQGVEQVAEFFAPASALTKIKGALKTGVGLLDAVAGMGIEGASAAAVDAAQKGTVADAWRTGALTAGTGLGLQAVTKAAQKPATWLAERIESALLKPTAGVLEGLTPMQMVRNLFKHDLGGTLGQTYDKVNQRLAEKTAQLRSILHADPTASVKLAIVARDTLADFSGNKQAAEALERIREAVEFGLNERGVNLGRGVLNLADGNVAKQAVGELGAWIHDITGKTTTDADRVLEKVANRFYAHLKTAIERKATGDIAAVNRELSELIPIKAAIIRRIPVAERSNVLNAGDLAAGIGTVVHPSALGLSIANRLLQSGRAANVLSKAGRVDATGAATTGARLTGASQ